METRIYDFKALSNKGTEVDFGQYEGKVLLIVNTASKCGFTPQYDALEELCVRQIESGDYLVEGVDAEIALPLFDAGQVAPVQTYHQRKLLLSQRMLGTQLFDAPSDTSSVRRCIHA